MADRRPTARDRNSSLGNKQTLPTARTIGSADTLCRGNLGKTRSSRRVRSSMGKKIAPAPTPVKCPQERDSDVPDTPVKEWPMCRMCKLSFVWLVGLPMLAALTEMGCRSPQPAPLIESREPPIAVRQRASGPVLQTSATPSTVEFDH